LQVKNDLFSVVQVLSLEDDYDETG